jgi:hypothetical protein
MRELISTAAEAAVKKGTRAKAIRFMGEGSKSEVLEKENS